VGPLVLAGDWGRALSFEQARGPRPEVPVLVAPEQPVANWLKPVAGKPGTFRTTGAGLKQEIDFVPFYELSRRRYAVYWTCTPAEWTKRSRIPGPGRKAEEVGSGNIGFAQPGQMQAERDSNQQGEDSSTVRAEGRFGRAATKWFSFDLPVDAAHPLTLIVTYSNENRGPSACSGLRRGPVCSRSSGHPPVPSQALGPRFLIAVR